MPQGYTVERDDGEMCVYCKTHKNNEQTRVKIEKVGTEAADGIKYLVNVDDALGMERLGKFETKQEARREAKNWMKNNPKGLQNTIGGGVLPGANDSGQWGGFF